MSWGPGCPPGNILHTGLTGNAGGQTVTAGTQAFVMFNGQATQLNFTTERDGQVVVVLLSLTRSNSDAAGDGAYTLYVDGVAGAQIMKSFDLEQQTLSAMVFATIPLKGAHFIQIRCAATTGNEVLVTPAQLIILGAE